LASNSSAVNDNSVTIDAHKRKINHITSQFVDGNSQKRIKVSHSTPGNTDANALLHI
jgi:hypothetical protein